MPRRDPFPFRRERIIESLEKLMRYYNMTPEQFFSNWEHVSAAKGELVGVGGNMHPESHHASENTARPFREFRNELAHQYYHVQPDEIWEVIRAVPQLLKEVRERTHPPPRIETPDPPSPGDLGR